MSCTSGRCSFADTTLDNVRARMITAEEITAITNLKAAAGATSKKWTLASNEEYAVSNKYQVVGTRIQNQEGTESRDLKWLIENTFAYSDSGATQDIYGDI